MNPHELTATQALPLLRRGELSVEALAGAHLARIRERDEAVRGWAFLDPEAVLEKARALDAAPVIVPTLRRVLDAALAFAISGETA